MQESVRESKSQELTESNKELRALIMEAKNQLTKLNLENAKLVYQNKALNSASLNERQKNQIVEAVQTASSVEEAKMIFETIQNAVGVSLVIREHAHKHFVKRFKDLRRFYSTLRKTTRQQRSKNGSYAAFSRFE